jgi:hypothetical protein
MNPPRKKTEVTQAYFLALFILINQPAHLVKMQLAKTQLANREINNGQLAKMQLANLADR